MGYTHYWDFEVTDEFREAFPRFLMEVKQIVDYCANELGIYVTGDRNFPTEPPRKPAVSESAVYFNGCSQAGDDPNDEFVHETILIRLKRPEGMESFCKTGQLPYDIVVTSVLLRAAQTLPGFELASDGDWSRDGDWGTARKVIASLFGDERPPARGRLIEEYLASYG